MKVDNKGHLTTAKPTTPAAAYAYAQRVCAQHTPTYRTLCLHTCYTTRTVCTFVSRNRPILSISTPCLPTALCLPYFCSFLGARQRRRAAISAYRQLPPAARGAASRRVTCCGVGGRGKSTMYLVNKTRTHAGAAKPRYVRACAYWRAAHAHSASRPFLSSSGLIAPGAAPLRALRSHRARASLPPQTPERRFVPAAFAGRPTKWTEIPATTRISNVRHVTNTGP